MATVTCITCQKQFEHNGTRGPRPKECSECRRSNGHSKSTTIIYRAKYSWSKYGSDPKLEKNKQDEWHCQMCGKSVPKELPAYLFEAFPGEYIKLCSDCQNFATNERIFDFKKLIKLVR